MKKLNKKKKRECKPVENNLDHKMNLNNMNKLMLFDIHPKISNNLNPKKQISTNIWY
jgi:hypothetical protein